MKTVIILVRRIDITIIVSDCGISLFVDRKRDYIPKKKDEITIHSSATEYLTYVGQLI